MLGRILRRAQVGRIPAHNNGRRWHSTDGQRREQYGSFMEEWRKYKFPVALGFTCVALVQLRRVLARQPVEAARLADPSQPGQEVIEPISFGPHMNEFVIAGIENVPPYRWMSNVWGKMARLDLQFSWIKDVVFGGWAYMYNCNLSEMKFPFHDYKSLSEFFLRPLSDGVRHIDADSPGALVSPCDGRVLHVGTVDMTDVASMSIEAVKGSSYKFEDFVGKFPEGLVSGETVSPKGKNRKMQTIVLYLAPGDYHHFHSPADWTVLQRRHFPGTLLPVRPWAVLQVKDLYCKNERVVLNGRWEGGFFSFGAVGALNVGSIGITFDTDLRTNMDSSYPFQGSSFKVSQRDYPIPVPQVRGQPVGSFNLGSTVVLLFESSEEFEFSVVPGQVVRVGQRIGTDRPRESPRALVPAPPWPGMHTVEVVKTQLDSIRNS